MPKELMGNRVSEVGDAMARVLLQIEMKRRHVSYRDLSNLLNKSGISENERNLRNKIARGKFSAGFLLICLQIMEVMQVRLDFDNTTLQQLGLEGFGPGIE